MLYSATALHSSAQRVSKPMNKTGGVYTISKLQSVNKQNGELNSIIQQSLLPLLHLQIVQNLYYKL